MKHLTILIIIFVTGCDTQRGEHTGEKMGMFSKEICKNGVVYYINGQGIAPAFKQDGSLYLCEINK